ncbi:polysaccharide deacetylase 2 family uncharacterized protein YibQ [Litoreibacter meonggei]|uniref:Polysaccharide deacetylase 2 family uncharacterized protein YibQ n=1 Tax=Litoreibacter meonggei TaxID=1049199 RepID=A0A497VEL4_9RHOB|nr:divergent polysaccharide deacetylase family protein [Litoreibacter meonggei]RLJ41772.1 polysaccharide deacetylase 2 family uncharacterized protein YibQ [Litoreibacter meonggei]
MGKGIGAGIVSGGFVGVVVMSILSLYAPLPQDRIDAAPKLEVETTQPEAVAPENVESSAAPQADTAPKVTPSTDASDTVTAVVESTTASEASPLDIPETQQDAPVVQSEAPQLDTNIATDTDSPTAEIATSDAQVAQLIPQAPAVQPEGNDEIIIASADPSPAPVAQVQTGVQAPAVEASPNVEASTDTTSPSVQPSELTSPTVVGTEQTADIDAPVLPRVTSLPTIGDPQQDPVEVASADTPITLPQVNSGVVTNRLPSVGGSSTLITTAPEEAAPEAVAVDPAELGALRAFSTKVEGTEGKTLFGVILIDSGEDGIPRDDLMELSVPVTIAIDPTAKDAARIMADYRQAGMEVIVIANELPTASSPSDVAVAVEAYFAILNESVGILDPLDARIQSNRTLLQPVLGAIRNSGHGLVTYDRGLNTAQQAARREDIPAATVFRVLDADLEESPKIKRYLDRAAFNANRDGSVVVVGRSYPETVKAIVEWVLEKKEAGIAMVPVSSVMLADEAS